MHILECLNCGSEFSCQHKRRHCGVKCRKHYGRRKRRGEDVSIHSSPVGRNPGHVPAVCVRCGCDFMSRKVSRKVAGRDIREFTTHCSRDCYFQTMAIERARRLLVSSETSALRRISRAVRSRASREADRGVPSPVCVGCGKPIEYVFGRPKKRCPSCQRARRSETRRHVPSKPIQRARHYGVHYEHVSPWDVMARDWYHCSACGTYTPPRLRGSYEWNAPEIDHVVPISRGGPHVASNLQLMCRSCNIDKGNTVPRGHGGIKN